MSSKDTIFNENHAGILFILFVFFVVLILLKPISPERENMILKNKIDQIQKTNQTMIENDSLKHVLNGLKNNKHNK